MSLKRVLADARELLAANNIEDAHIEGELLLRHTLKINRAQLYLDFDCELSPEQQETFWRLIERRLTGEPSAYITGHREFYGLDFHVDPSVLIPRPESELLVERSISLAENGNVATIAEIGTGCGAIAISLALNLTEAKIYATDISASALKVALFNCQKHGVENRISLLQGDVLEPLPGPVDLIVANLPYVREPELPRAGPVSFEPVVALDGGSDGLRKIYKLCQEASAKLRPEGFLLLEVGQGQSEAVVAFLCGLFPSAQIEVAPDLGGIERVVSLRLTQSRSNAKIPWILPELKSKR